MTPQGRAIKQAALDFGNGQTLPFTPCKKGYIPVVDGERKVACPLHNQAREMRLKKEGGTFRMGEIDLKCFWSKGEESFAIHSQTGDFPSLGDDAKTNITCDSNKKIKVES
jgi:hypothetical protein